MRLLFENWRKYLNEQNISPITGKPYPAGVSPGQYEEYDDWAAGKFSPGDATSQPAAGKSMATGEKDLETQIKLLDMKTIGDLQKAINRARNIRAKGKLKGAVISKIPYLQDVIDLKDALKKFAKLPDDKKTNTALDALNIDDEISAIVDDSVEENFLNWLSDSFKDMDPETELQKLNMNKLLQKFLKSRYDQRSVTIPKDKI